MPRPRLRTGWRRTDKRNTTRLSDILKTRSRSIRCFPRHISIWVWPFIMSGGSKRPSSSSIWPVTYSPKIIRAATRVWEERRSRGTIPLRDLRTLIPIIPICQTGTPSSISGEADPRGAGPPPSGESDLPRGRSCSEESGLVTRSKMEKPDLPAERLIIDSEVFGGLHPVPVMLSQCFKEQGPLRLLGGLSADLP